MRKLDVKDLEILREIHATKSISLTAERVGLSQPTVSIRIGQMRTRFRDPLFVRTSTGMQPTLKISALMASIHQALGLFEGGLPAEEQFDPRTSTRTFRVCMTDIGQIVILSIILNRLISIAPSIKIEVLPLNEETPRLLESGAADIAIGFTMDIPGGFFQQQVTSDYFVCMVRRDHPCIRARVTRKQFEAQPQIDVVTKGTGHYLLYKALDDAKVSRKVVVRVPSFLGLAQIVASTDLLALVPDRLGRILSRTEKVRILDAPIKLPSYAVRQYWHERYHRDPANNWLRSLVARLFKEHFKQLDT